MFIQKIVLLLLSFVLITLTLPQANLSAQANPPSDAPYIYYYSDWLDSFVIERADGSDSRLFGEGLIPDKTDMIGGGGWSPSGEWFAFLALGQRDIGGRNFRGGGVLHVNGTRHIDLSWIDKLEQADWLEHPSRELLLLRRSNPIGFEGYEGRFGLELTDFYIMDVETGIILVNALATPFIDTDSVKIHWFPDKEKLVISYLDYYSERTIFRIYNLDGSFDEIQLDELPLWNYSSEISDIGWVILQAEDIDGNGYAMRFNVLTQEIEQLAIPTSKASFWSSTLR